jgi:hypothetical protein
MTIKRRIILLLIAGLIGFIVGILLPKNTENTKKTFKNHGIICIKETDKCL